MSRAENNETNILFLFLAFLNGIPVFKQTVDHCFYGKTELPKSMEKAMNAMRLFPQQVSHLIETVARSSYMP